MVFDPIGGSLAAVALLDPAFRAVSWIYGKYKLTREFGAHWNIYTIKYRSEVDRFEWIRDLEIKEWQRDPLESSSQRLSSGVRDRLLLCIKAFEECDNLMKSHHHAQGSENAVTEDGISIDDLLLARSSSADGTSTTKSKDIPFPSQQKEHKKWYSFRKSKRIAPDSETFAPVRDASSSPQRALIKLGERSTKLQKESKIMERITWSLATRGRFIGLLSDLKDHLDFFTSYIGLRFFSQAQNISHLGTKSAVETGQKMLGRQLSRLISSLAALEGITMFQCELRLHDNPSHLKDLLEQELRSHVSFRPSSSVFAMQLWIHSSEISQSQPQTVKNSSIFAEIPVESNVESSEPTNIDPENPGGVSTDVDLENREDIITNMDDLQRRISMNDGATSRSFCHPLGKLKTGEDRVKQPIAMFRDDTDYIRWKTLEEALSDQQEIQLQQKTYLEDRIRLAYVLASSLLHFVLAGFLPNYHSSTLYYYKDQGENNQIPQGHELAALRRTPHITLPGIHAPRSSAKILTGAADRSSKGQSMIQNLGVVMYEIGLWKKINTSEHDWRSRSAEAKLGATELIRTSSSPYYRIVDDCLSWTTNTASTNEEVCVWLIDHVTRPLKSILEHLEKDAGIF